MSNSGLCMCGCGEKTRIATHNDKSKGWVKGVPLKFALGHNLTKLNKGKTVSAIGNKSISSGGYICVQVACRTRVYEHILVAEKALGRKLVNLGKGNPMSEVVHHIDGNKQNNAPSNLLICTHQYHVELHARLERSEDWPQFGRRLNHPIGCKQFGRSGFKGVGFSKGGRWSAHITINGKKKNLGTFDSAKEAARAYDCAAKSLRGSSWITNENMGLL